MREQDLRNGNLAPAGCDMQRPLSVEIRRIGVRSFLEHAFDVLKPPILCSPPQLRASKPVYGRSLRSIGRGSLRTRVLPPSAL